VPRSNPTLVHSLTAPLRVLRLPRLRRATQRRLGYGILAMAILLAAYLWVRDSSFVAVRQVEITGVTSSEEGKVREALRETATGMTTLHVRTDRLREAVAPYASVGSLRVDASFPHALAIEVVERVPAAALVSGDGERVAVSAGGRLLRGVKPDADLPVVGVGALPAGTRISDRGPRAAIAILAAAPPELHRRVERARSGTKGLQLELRNGPDLIFGSDARAVAKWQAAARVLADSGSKGALYLDLRIPERTVAGGVGPVDTTDDAAPAPDVTANPQPQP
jgi:cell division protein FtsQ